MRKLSIILAVAVMATISFSSCGEKSLKGTSWKSEVLGREYVIFNFTSATECKAVFYWDDEEDGTLTGTYTYNHPNVAIDFGFYAKYTGIVDGNKMTLTHEAGKTFTVNKQ